MAEFSAADAAFTGFRIVWERPVSVLYWTLLRLVALAGVNIFIVLTAGPAFTRLLETMTQLNADPAQMAARLEQAAPTFLVLVCVELVVFSVLSAAINRAVLRPDQWRFGYLRLASDELRQLGLFALLLALAIGGYLTLFVAISMLVALLGFAIGDAAAIGLGVVLLAALAIAGLLIGGVRLSLASPRTFDTGRIDLVGAWRMTRGRFWPLAGTYLMALGLSLVVQALALAITVFSAAIVSGGFEALNAQAQTQFNSLAAALTPVALVNLVVSAAGQALSFPITAAPPASVYRALGGSGVRSGGKVFE